MTADTREAKRRLVTADKNLKKEDEAKQKKKLDTARSTNIFVIASNYRHLSYGVRLTTVRRDVLEANVVSIRL